MKRSLLILVALALIAPSFVYAEDDAELEVAGWIPYWRDSQGIKDAKKNLKDIDVVYPFAFTVTTGGELRDQAGLTDSEWKRFTKSAQRKDVEVIPTVMWSDRESIHRVLSDDSLREDHIDEIVKMVKKGKFDGVGIDYESKKSETIHYFSLFLKELKKELGKKILTCTLEARTPPDSLYKDVPKVINYANDYTEIAKHCDRVELMAYDQQRADIKLNEKRTGLPYMPVADIEWVEKVVELALKSFDEDQVILGIPTYGYHYTVTVAPDWYKSYSRIGALNMPDMLDIADEYKVTPGRNAHGEMSFTYFPESSPYRLLNGLETPKGTPKGYEAAAKALLFANMTGMEVPVRLATYSGAEAMKDKIDLAKEYGLRGVALFKFDGEEDQGVWKYLR
jgi:spore germination protein YaaH